MKLMLKSDGIFRAWKRFGFPAMLAELARRLPTLEWYLSVEHSPLFDSEND
jgi:hypothetical protein